MYDVGDIVSVYSPLKNAKKYHLCLIKPTNSTAGLFLFLNSENRFNNSYAVGCDRIPQLPTTQSTQSYICCEQILYNDLMLKAHLPTKICVLDTKICEELLDFVKTANFIERRIRSIISDALEKIIEKRRSKI
jgi:hypothetical protein